MPANFFPKKGAPLDCSCDASGLEPLAVRVIVWREAKFGLV